MSDEQERGSKPNLERAIRLGVGKWCARTVRYAERQRVDWDHDLAGVGHWIDLFEAHHQAHAAAETAEIHAVSEPNPSAAVPVQDLEATELSTAYEPPSPRPVNVPIEGPASSLIVTRKSAPRTGTLPLADIPPEVQAYLERDEVD